MTTSAQNNPAPAGALKYPWRLQKFSLPPPHARLCASYRHRQSLHFLNFYSILNDASRLERKTDTLRGAAGPLDSKKIVLIYATADEADAYMFYMFFSVFFLFFFCFSVRHKNTRQPFSGTAKRIFMKLLPHHSGENIVSNLVPKWGLGPQIILWRLKTTHCALGGDAWRVTDN